MRQNPRQLSLFDTPVSRIMTRLRSPTEKKAIEREARLRAIKELARFWKSKR
jgi:hypothetical protein